MKKLVIGIIIGLAIGVSTNAFAAIGDKVESIFAEFTIIVNGEEKTLDATPLVYNGTSYLPVRTMANLVGFDVTYLSNSRTIEFNKAVQSYLNDAEVLKEKNRGGGIVAKEAYGEKIMTIDEIDGRISSLKLGIKANEIAIEVQETLTDSDRLLYESQNIQWRAEIAELEAKKAALTQ